MRFDQLALTFQSKVGVVPVVAQLRQLGLEEGGGGIHTAQGNFRYLKFIVGGFDMKTHLRLEDLEGGCFSGQSKI